jgi:hypothetical protein
MTKEGYKVTQHNNRSAWSMKSLKYKINKKTKRPIGCGPLAVFDDLQSAKKFASIPDRIYRCIYKKSNDNILWYKKETQIGPLDKKKTWGFPLGTRFADWVILLNEVK